MRRFMFSFVAVLASMAIPTTIFADSPAIPTVLNDLYVHQWVTLGAEGNLTGTVSEAQANEPQKLGSVKVAVVRGGEVLHVAESNADGRFEIKDVKPGTYSLIARGEGTLAAFSLQVLSPENGKHLSNEIDVRCIRPVGDKVHEILRSQVVPPYLTRLVSAATRESDPIANVRKFADTHVIAANEDGEMVGQLGKTIPGAGDDLSDMVVYITREGGEVARASVEKDGTFKVAGMKPGSYGLVAAGSNGFAALSFQFTNPAIADTSSSGARLVGRRHGCPKLNCEVIQCCDVQCCEQPIVETVVASQPVECCDPVVSEVVVDPVAPAPAYGMGGWGGYGGGFGGGGGGFGGGGGGGFGGMGGLAGIAGIAGIAAVAANQDDDFIPVPIESNN